MKKKLNKISKVVLDISQQQFICDHLLKNDYNDLFNLLRGYGMLYPITGGYVQVDLNIKQ